jgi:hypothetical protein
MIDHADRGVLLQKQLWSCYRVEAALTSDAGRLSMTNPSLFTGRHVEADIILCAVRWYLR